MKTFTARPADIDKKWILVDAEDVVLGRMASQIALILLGKHKPSYTPHMDCGDNVVVINAGKVKLTGKKLKDKIYYRHTGYPGGIKERRAGEILAGKYPERVVQKAIERMIPGGPLGRHRHRRAEPRSRGYRRPQPEEQEERLRSWPRKPRP